VFVQSNRDAVVDSQTYALKLDGSTANKPARVTQGDGCTMPRLRAMAKCFDTYSNPDLPPQVSIRRPDGSMVSWLERNELNASHPYGKYLDAHLKTEYGTLKSKDGQTLYYSMIKPSGFSVMKKYPVSPVHLWRPALAARGAPLGQSVRPVHGPARLHRLAPRQPWFVAPLRTRHRCQLPQSGQGAKWKTN
jgi:dipeptidyl aminopeptidase/acylaminoacyl peptidase